MPYISTIAKASANGLGYRGAEPAIGQPFQGGYYAGAYQVSGQKYYLIVALKFYESLSSYWTGGSPNANATSVINGSLNTNTLVAQGTSIAAIYCNNFSYGGYTDWYLPAQWELEICYYNLKPSTSTNSVSTGQNPYSIPSRSGVSYTTTIPKQTSVGIFQAGGAQEFGQLFYWTSTSTSTNEAMTINFSSGSQSSISKTTTNLLIRPVRKVYAGTV